MSGHLSRTGPYFTRIALAVAFALVAAPLTSPTSVASAQTLGTPSLSVNLTASTNCSGSGGDYSCTSPTVTLQGSADENTTIVAADSYGLWLGETTSDSSGIWGLSVTLPAGASAPATYELDAFELDTTLGEQGSASSAISVTVSSNQLVTNGDFGDPAVETPCAGCSPTTGNWENFPQGSGDVPGWDSTNSCGIELQTEGTNGVTPYGGSTQYAELASNCVSGVTQTISTVLGAQYTLTFAYQARPDVNMAAPSALSCPSGWTVTQANENTMAVQWGGSYIAGTSTPGSGLQGGSSWQVATYNLTATGTSTVLEFDDTNPCALDSYGDFLDNVSVVPTETLAPSNTSWESAQPITLSSTTGGGSSGSGSQAISFAGETLWYDFPVQPGEQVSVQFSNPADYQALLFSDITQAAATGAGPDGVPTSQAESASNNDSAANFAPAYENPAYENPAYENPAYDNPAYENPAYENPAYENPAYENPAYDNPAYENSAGDAVVDSLLGESSPGDSSTQSVDADTWNATGNFYIEVLSDSGGFSSAPYTVTVTASGGACPSTLESYTDDLATPVTGGNLPPVPTSPAEPYSTVIVDNSTAMPQVSPTYTGTDGIYQSLNALAEATNGVVLDVAQSEGIQELMSQAQAPANVSCPYAENLEAQGIQDLINTYRAYSTGGAPENNLKYVVIIGDDDVVPFFRYADAETIGPEDTYQVPLSSTSAAEAALEDDYYLTDDQYGASSELDIDNTLLPVQSAAVGRLVETSADIQSAISRYLAQEVIQPTSTLATGYSFMAQGASEVEQYFSSGVPGSANGPDYNDQLIDTPPNGTAWTATDLLNSLTLRPHQLVFLGAHFNANVALSADDSTYLTTQEFASAIGNDLENSLVVSTGCHSGYTIDPADATPLTDTLSWPQAFTEAGATLIAGTGYQFGDSNYVAYSGQLYVDLAQQLYQTGGGAVPVGTALLDAESQYLASLDQLNGLEEKALLEVTLYGLPMLGVQEPSASNAPVATPSTQGVVSTSSNLIFNGPASTLGTAEYDLPVGVPAFDSYTPPGQPTTTPLSYDTLPQNQLPQGQFAASQVVADPGAPIVPVVTEDVNVPNYTLTGVGFWGGNYSDTSGAPPLTGDPVTDSSELASPFSSPVYLPQRLTNPNYFGTLDTGAGTELGITPEQYISDPTTPGNAINREYSSLDLHLFYSPNSSDAGLASSPNISDVIATESGGEVAVSATVLGSVPGSVQEVWVTHTDPPTGGGDGTWASVDLAPSATNPALWTGTFSDSSPGDAVFEVQAANSAGEVSLDNNGGYYFSPTVLTPSGTPPPGPASTTLALSGDTSDGFGTAASVSATLTTTSSSPLVGQQVTFSIGSAIATAITSSIAPGVATANIPLSNLQPGTYTLTATYNGNSSFAATSATEMFTVAPATTALSLAVPSNQLDSGAPNGISAQLTTPGLNGTGVAQKTVYFELTNPSTGAVAGGSTGETNEAGVADAGVITLPSLDAGNSYVVSAYFGSESLTLPNGTTINASDPDYAASATSSATPPNGPTVTVADTSQTSITVAPSSSIYGQTVKLTAAVSLASPGSPVAVPTGDGTVAFSQDGSVIAACGAQPVTAGSATCTLSSVTAGSHKFTASYSGYEPNGASAPLYLSSESASESATVNQATPTVNWSTPAAITYGTKLSSTQLDATASVPGTFAYTPAAGTVLTPGVQTLDVVFTPTDSTDYEPVPTSTTISVTTEACISKTESESLVVAKGQAACLEAGGKITGSVSVSAGGSLWVTGGTIGGSLSASGATAIGLSGVAITGSVSVTGTTGPVSISGGSIGGSVSLASNTGGVAISGGTIGGSASLSSNSGGLSLTTEHVTGSLSISSNSGGVLIIGNTITGSAAVTSNTGGVTFTNNTVGGSLSITGNSGGFTYSSNTVHGSVNNSGNH